MTPFEEKALSSAKAMLRYMLHKPYERGHVRFLDGGTLEVEVRACMINGRQYVGGLRIPNAESRYRDVSYFRGGLVGELESLVQDFRHGISKESPPLGDDDI